MIQYSVSFLKGLLIGIAVIVPGVSGGTVALITGLYEKIISALSSVRLKMFLKKKEFLKFINQFSDLIPAFFGGLIGFFAAVQWMVFLIASYPVAVYGLFSGLILASAPLLFEKIKINRLNILMVALSSIFVFCLSFFNAFSFEHPLWTLFSVYLAILAVLLPGVSGSYILVLMGTYSFVLRELSRFSWMNFLFILMGVLVLTTGSRGIEYLLKRYHSLTMAVLIGMMLGGGFGIFPIKSTALLKEQGFQTILFFLIGVLLIFVIKKSEGFASLVHKFLVQASKKS